jgi:hypothetical protein
MRDGKSVVIERPQDFPLPHMVSQYFERMVAAAVITPQVRVPLMYSRGDWGDTPALPTRRGAASLRSRRTHALTWASPRLHVRPCCGAALGGNPGRTPERPCRPWTPSLGPPPLHLPHSPHPQQSTLGPVLRLLQDRRGEQVELAYLDKERVMLRYLLPWQEVCARGCPPSPSPSRAPFFPPCSRLLCRLVKQAMGAGVGISLHGPMLFLTHVVHAFVRTDYHGLL